MIRSKDDGTNHPGSHGCGYMIYCCRYFSTNHESCMKHRIVGLLDLLFIVRFLLAIFIFFYIVLPD